MIEGESDEFDDLMRFMRETPSPSFMGSESSDLGELDFQMMMMNIPLPDEQTQQQQQQQTWNDASLHVHIH